MKLYAHPFSSYSQKVLIALYENQTPFEYRMLEDDGAMAELTALWPMKRFPILLDDGRTMVDTGGVALKSLDADGNEIDKSTLVARLAEGGEAPQHDSVFDGDNVLSTAKGLPDYLAMDVKNVYQLEIDAAQMAAVEIAATGAA